MGELKGTPQSNTPKDEIDLYFIYQKLELLLGSIGRSISNFFRALYLQKWLLLTFTMLGLGVAYLNYRSTKPYYTSSMTLVLAEIRNQFVENQLKRLSIMIQEDNYQAVSEELDISEEAAKQIKVMQFSNIDQNLISEDSVLTGSPFEIELTLYNTAYFASLEPALSNYLENNRYFYRQKLIKQREIESLISKLEGDIKAIDSVKTQVTSPNGPVNGFVYGSPVDPTNLFRESMNMYQQQVSLKGDLEKLDNIQIVNSFAPRLRPSGPNLMKYLAIGGGIGFLLGIPVALKLERRRRSKF